jgi:hypothetical protein
MDISKLPKLSNTPEAAKNAHEERPAPPPPPAGVPSGSGPTPTPRELVGGFAEAWISIAIGLILLFVFPNTIQYFKSADDFAKVHQYTDAQSNPITYTQSAFFLADLGVTVFALALLVEGIMLTLARKATLIYVTLVITVAAAAFNLFVVIKTYDDIGFQIVCAFGVAVCIYMALMQWRLIGVLRGPV